MSQGEPIQKRGARTVMRALWGLVTAGLLSACYSASLLAGPEPAPEGTLRGGVGVGLMPYLKSHETNDRARPMLEAAVRYGVSPRADVGLKAGPIFTELNSLVALWQHERAVFSLLPSLHLSWLVEEPRVITIHMSRTPTPLEGFSKATRVTSFRLPMLIGVWNKSGHWGMVTGPTVHAGYRGCKRQAPAEGAEDYPTCIGLDKGSFVAAGAHFGLRISVGAFARIAPEVSFVRTVMGPEARVVRYDSARRYMSQGDMRLQFAFGVHVGDFFNSPSARRQRERRRTRKAEKEFFFD